MKTYTFKASYISPAVITFNPNAVNQYALDITLNDKEIYVRHHESDQSMTLLPPSQIRFKSTSSLWGYLIFEIVHESFGGRYAIYDWEHQEGIEQFLKAICTS